MGLSPRMSETSRFQVSDIWFKGSTFKGSEVDNHEQKSDVSKHGRAGRTLEPFNPEP